MRYVLTEADLALPLVPLEIPSDAEGAGVLVRFEDRPIAFFLAPLRPERVEPEQVRKLIFHHAEDEITAELLRHELMPRPRTERLPSLTVAICTRDHPELTERAIRSLLVSAEAACVGDALDILVVDNAPTDNRTREMASRFQSVRYTLEPKPGLDFARNRAIAEAAGEILAFVDDDAVVDRWWHRGLAKALRENPDASVITGPVLPYELETPAQILFEARGGFGRRFEPRRFGPECRYVRNYPCNAGYFGAGCNMAFRREALLGLGGFNEALDTGPPLPGGGDLDILYRALRAGYVLVQEPQFVIRHQHRREYRALRHQMFTWGLGMMTYAVANYARDPAFRGHFRCMIAGWFRATTKVLIASARGRGNWKTSLAWWEIWGGIVGLCGEYGRSMRRVERIRKRFA